ncbi:terminase small subunit [Desulfopila sp. IMCC35008]|uniref:terminase small subunit n=1 Tax=Desulfopila sp. IMCC35008 TaxID=2653858 RepID=UPI0013D62099|nr:terminase small subunit [Desulfopila sp. IMCC35008]
MDKPKQKTGKAIKLSSKREKFCREYIIDHNATQAYIRAGYSENGASQGSERLLRIVEVNRRIEELQAEENEKLSDKYRITRERIMRERGRIAFFDFRDLYDAGGNLKQPHEWDDDTAACVSSVKFHVSREGNGYGNRPEVAEVRLWNKDASLSALEKIEGMYAKDNEQLNPYRNLTREELNAKLEEILERSGLEVRKKEKPNP